MADPPPPYYDNFGMGSGPKSVKEPEGADEPEDADEPARDEDEIAKAVAAAAEYMRQSTYDAYARADIN